MCKDTCALPFQFNPWRKFSELDDILNIMDHLKGFWRVPLWIGQERSLKLYTTVNTYLELASVLEIGGSIFLFIRLFCKLDILLIPVLIQYIMRKKHQIRQKKYPWKIFSINQCHEQFTTAVFNTGKFWFILYLSGRGFFEKKPLVEESFSK